MKSNFVVFAAAFALVAAGCARRTNVEAEKAALLNTDKEWAEAASAGKDVERIISFWADDAIIIPSGGPVVKGKEAIRQYVAQSLKMPGFSINWESEEVDVSASGDLGYTVGRNKFTFPDKQGNLITSVGRGITVWRKESNGVWKCVVDIWNEESPPEAAANVSGE